MKWVAEDENGVTRYFWQSCMTQKYAVFIPKAGMEFVSDYIVAIDKKIYR
jgi:hypothetical protein